MKFTVYLHRQGWYLHASHLVDHQDQCHRIHHSVLQMRQQLWSVWVVTKMVRKSGNNFGQCSGPCRGRFLFTIEIVLASRGHKTTGLGGSHSNIQSEIGRELTFKNQGPGNSCQGREPVIHASSHGSSKREKDQGSDLVRICSMTKHSSIYNFDILCWWHMVKFFHFIPISSHMIAFCYVARAIVTWHVQSSVPQGRVWSLRKGYSSHVLRPSGYISFVNICEDLLHSMRVSN